MSTWLRRHGFALAAVALVTFLGSIGLDHHSPARDWIVRAAIFGAIVLPAYLVCNSQIELIDRANHSRPVRLVIILAVILGATAPRFGDAAIVAVAGVFAGAAIALDRAGLMVRRNH